MSFFWHFVFCFSGCWGFCLDSVLWVVEPTVNFVLFCLKTKNCSQFNCGQFLVGISLALSPSMLPLSSPLFCLRSVLLESFQFCSVPLPQFASVSFGSVACLQEQLLGSPSLATLLQLSRGHPLLAQQAKK